MPLLSDIAKEKKKLTKETKEKKEKKKLKKEPKKKRKIQGKVLNLDRFPHFAAALMPLLHLNSPPHSTCCQNTKNTKFQNTKFQNRNKYLYSALFTLTVQRTLT